MHECLMPSQKKCMKKILEQEDAYYRRANILLAGDPQIGKTHLLKHISNINDRYLYVNFTKQYLECFLNKKRLGSIGFYEFQMFLRETFGKYTDRVIILDEIDSVISILIQGKEGNLLGLYKQFLSMDQSIKYLFVTSRFVQDITDRLANIYGSRVIILEFTREDKEHIIKTCFENINLFQLDEISNLRQMLRDGE